MIYSGRQSRLCLLALLWAATSPLSAAGQPFLVSSGPGSYPSLAKDPRGGFSVAWVKTAVNEVFARRFGAHDEALTGELSLGAYDYAFPTVSVAAAGGDRYRVAWDRIPHYYGGTSVSRTLRPGAPALGALLQLGAFASPDVAVVDAEGDFAVALGGAAPAASGGVRSGIFVQLRSAAGRLRRQVFLGPGFAPQISAAGGGAAWVVWTSERGVQARLLASDGSVTRALRATASLVNPPAIAGNDRGELAIVWHEALGIMARWLDPRRGVLGPIRVVATDPLGTVSRISAAMDAEGKTFVVWSPCCAAPRVLGRRFERRGGNAGGVFSPQQGTAFAPDVAASAAGDFTLVWEDTNGIRGKTLRWARPGDELCRFAGGRWRCDAAHDGGEAELVASFGGPVDHRPLLADVDGDGRDDLCLIRGAELRCDTAHDEGGADTVLPLLAGDFDTVLTGDLDGEGRDDFCGWRDGVLACDTAHDGGSAEVVVRLAAGGTPLLGDLDGDGDDDPCAANRGVFSCDLDHDGAFDATFVLPAAGSDEAPLLGDVDGDGLSDPCLYGGERLRCDAAREGNFGFEIALAPSADTVLLGNPDGI